MAAVGLPLLALLLSAAGPVIETGPAVFHSGRVRSAEAVSPVRAAGRLPEAARHDLPALSPGERRELEAKDSRSGLRRKVPAVKVGVSRALPGAVGFSAVPANLARGQSRVASGGLFERGADGRLSWTAAFSSEGAGALRLHVAQAVLPAGSRAYVYAAGGEVHGPYAFDRGTRPEGFWTNTVFAPEVFLQVQWPAGGDGDPGASRLSVSAVVHLEHPGFAPGSGQGAFTPKSQTCFVDAACVTPAEFPNIDDATHAIGQLTFVDGGSAFVCTGGLMNATPETFVPYLLTANHCFSNQPAATSLEAVWDYLRPVCDGPEPSKALFPRTLGSTLLATGETSDFTLVQLSEEPPDGSVFLGWTTAEVAFAGGTILYRLSNPDGRPQFYTKEQVSATPTPVSCAGIPQGDFIYEKDIVGGTGGGSSGSPVYLQSLQVVGQEGGACGTNVEDDCAVFANSTIDGAFRVSFPSLQPWLSPGTPGPCAPNATTLCLNGGRFRVTVAWATNSGASGAGQAVPLTGDSGYFWFFNAANIEIVVKVLDACSVNDYNWVFAGGLTNVDVVMTVTDTESGEEKVYTNPLGTAFVPLQDTSAFSCP